MNDESPDESLPTAPYADLNADFGSRRARRASACAATAGCGS
jgi:hypothetical protein